MRRGLPAVRRRLPAALLVAALLAGCGTGGGPGESVPVLADRLEQVDAAVVAGDDDRTREAVAALVDDTEAALRAGDLSPEEADAITEAAEALLARLGEPSGSQDSDGAPTPAPTEEPEPDVEPQPEVEPPPAPEGPEPGKPDKPGKPEKPGESEKEEGEKPEKDEDD